jgi:hypothetical protein
MEEHGVSTWVLLMPEEKWSTTITSSQYDIEKHDARKD